MADSDTQSAIHWHALETAEVRRLLRSGEAGLSEDEVQRRLAEFGPNQLPQPRPLRFWVFLMHQFRSPLIYVLLLALLVSLAVGHLSDAIFIGVIVLFNALIGAVQEFHARRSADALHNMVSASAQVLRNGKWVRLSTEQLVPGDCVELVSGDRVPADLRLVKSDYLDIDESLLTGESVPVSKRGDIVLPVATPGMERGNLAFAGSMVSSGRGCGLVIRTGASTEVGQLARGLIATQPARPPLFQRVETFSKNLTIALLVVVAILAMVELARHTPPLTVFLTVVALAVSAIPEGLPVALTVVLSVSMRRMVRQHVIVRKLVAVESLGSCTVIAADKTGTLTQNQLTVRELLFPEGESIAMTDDYLESHRGIRLANQRRLHRAGRVAALCNEAKWQWNQGERRWEASGDTVDMAFLHMAEQLGMPPHELRDRYPPLDQIPYEPHRGFAATLHRDADRPFVCVKGALERLLPMCDTMATDGGDTAIDRDAMAELMHQLAARGARVLAVADGAISDSAQIDATTLGGLCLLALVAMVDPLRPEAKQAIDDCRGAGITVYMLTGDHPRTAGASARQLGLIDDEERVITGVELAAAQTRGDDALDALVAKSTVYARVTPDQKLSIVHSLIRQGQFVAVTGDGVNDAPALTAAHVGVAMAQRGTDVARESADLLVTDDNFSSLVAGIREGRIAYSNIRKAVFFLVSTGAAEVMLFILTSLFAMPLPLTAVQLLWLNLVTNGVQNLALAIEPGEGDEMQKAPRPPNEGLFNRLMVSRIVLAGVVMGALGFCCFAFLLHQGAGEEVARNYTLLLMVLFENVQIFNSRSETRSTFTHSLLSNPLLIAGVLAAQGLHIGAMFWPPLRDVLGVAPVAFNHWLALLGLAAMVIVAGELQKLYHAYVR